MLSASRRVGGCFSQSEHPPLPWSRLPFCHRSPRESSFTRRFGEPLFSLSDSARHVSLRSLPLKLFAKRASFGSPELAEPRHFPRLGRPPLLPCASRCFRKATAAPSLSQIPAGHDSAGVSQCTNQHCGHSPSIFIAGLSVATYSMRGAVLASRLPLSFNASGLTDLACSRSAPTLKRFVLDLSPDTHTAYGLVNKLHAALPALVDQVTLGTLSPTEGFPVRLGGRVTLPPFVSLCPLSLRLQCSALLARSSC